MTSVIGGAMPATSTEGVPDWAALDLRAGQQTRLAGGGRGIETYVCGSCGYGVRRARPPHHCPMCHGHDWRRERRRHSPAAADAGAARHVEAALMTLAKRGANRVIDDLASRSGAGEPVGFFCECTDPDCHKVVWLTVEAFAREADEPAWHALAPGHRAAVREGSEPS